MTREDQVRELCALAAATKTEAELTAILLQLQSVIREPIQNLRAIAAEEIPRAIREGRGLMSCLGAYLQIREHPVWSTNLSCAPASVYSPLLPSIRHEEDDEKK